MRTKRKTRGSGNANEKVKKEITALRNRVKD